MVHSLLDDQHIRRRRRSGRAPHRILDDQPRVSLKPATRARLAALLRVSALLFIVSGLTTGLVLVSTRTQDSAVVPDSLERAEMNLYHYSDPGVAADPLPAVEFERNEEIDYVVAAGDTLSDIADRYDLSYDLLAGYNGLDDPDSLSPGQRLLIPSADLVDQIEG